MEFNSWLEAQGFAAESLTATQRLALQAAWRAEQAAPTPVAAPVAAPAAAGDSFDEVLASARAENERRQAITQLVAKSLNENPDQIAALEKLGRLAIDGKWSPQQTELALLRTGRGNGPICYTPSTPAITAEVIEASVCRSGGLQTLEAQFDERTLSAADKHFRGGIGLCEMVEHSARANGLRDASVKRNLQATLRAAFREPAANEMYASIGPSTYSLSGILSNVANKFSREAFNFVEQAWSRITAKRSVPDFKAVSGYSLTGDLTYEKVASGGELKHGTLGEESYSNQADTYGKLIGISRKDLINDDLGALTEASKKLGRGGGLKINDVFWTVFLDNSSFFSSANGNYDTGTDTDFDADGLAAADALWWAMTDPDGKPMGHMAKILLVPPNLRIPALRLMNSQGVNKDDLGGDANPFAGMFEVVSSRYMVNSSFTGYSTTKWYMLCDPNDVPVIETVFLNGVEVPTIESADFDFDRLGIALRGYHDFGVALQEPRGGYAFRGT